MISSVLNDEQTLVLASDDPMQYVGLNNAALVNFEKLNSDTGTYYAAICNELTAHYNQSLIELKEIPTTSVFYSKAQIRLSAVYFELGELDQAKAILNNIKPFDEIEAEKLLNMAHKYNIHLIPVVSP